jgi:hypothetical protein
MTVVMNFEPVSVLYRPFHSSFSLPFFYSLFLLLLLLLLHLFPCTDEVGVFRQPLNQPYPN